MRDEFDAEDFCTVVFDEFFHPLIAHDNIVQHVLRLLKFVHTKISPTRLENLMKLTEPSADASTSSASGLPSSMAMLGSSGINFLLRKGLDTVESLSAGAARDPNHNNYLHFCDIH